MKRKTHKHQMLLLLMVMIIIIALKTPLVFHICTLSSLYPNPEFFMSFPHPIRSLTTADKGELYLIKIKYNNSRDQPREEKEILLFPFPKCFSTLGEEGSMSQLPLQRDSEKAKTMHGQLPFAIKVQKCGADNAKLPSRLRVSLGGYLTSKDKTGRKVRERDFLCFKVQHVFTHLDGLQH